MKQIYQIELGKAPSTGSGYSFMGLMSSCDNNTLYVLASSFEEAIEKATISLVQEDKIRGPVLTEDGSINTSYTNPEELKIQSIKIFSEKVIL